MNTQEIQWKGEHGFWHHERYDGNGYPDGLKGEEIPIATQVVFLADAYDILVSESAYRKGIPHKEAIRNILEGKSGAFNQLLLECLLDGQNRIQRELGCQMPDARCQMPDGIKFDCCPKISNFSEK
ncbi:hypothetical protein F110043I8_25190 [Ruminococcus sp. f11]